MFKVLTGSSPLGGTLSLQKETLNNAAKELENKLNAGNVQKVLAGGAYESASEVILFSIVEVEEPAKKDKSKKEK